MNKELLNKYKDYDFSSLFAKKGYAYFTSGNYNLNIIGIRNKGTKVTNQFDDLIIVIYRDNKGVWNRKIYSCTTDPGLTSLKNPSNSKGTAILVPGQYRGCWKVGLHKGKYHALCQVKPVKVYRDNNRDTVYDFNSKTIDSGIFGINIHKAGESSTQVNNWSAGCTVFQKLKDFNEFMYLCQQLQVNGKGLTYTYTLIQDGDN